MVEEQLAQEPVAAPGDPAGRARMRQLYGYLREQKVDVPDDYQVFEDKLVESPDRQKQLYDLLKGDEVDVPDNVDAFSAALTEGLKKKDLPESSPVAAAPAGPSLDGLAQVPGLGSGLAGLPTGDKDFVEQPQLSEQAADPRVPVVPIPEQPLLQAGQTFTDQPVPDGFERVPIGQADPYSFQGGDPTQIGPVNADAPGSYLMAADKGTEREGQRYVDKPLSKVAAGETKEQDRWTAAARNFGNQLLNMGKGVADFAAATDRRLESAAGVPEYYTAAMNPFQRGADAIESAKAPVAPFHERSTFRVANPQTWPMATSNAAALAAPVVLSALLPESKIAGAVQTMLGVGFDGALLESSFERAKQAGLTPGSKESDLYALADGTATMLTFKLGAAGLNAAGQALVRKELVKNAMTELRSTFATRVTQERLQGVFARAAQKAAPILKNAVKEGATMGVLFGANEAKTVAGERISNATLGGSNFPEQSAGEVAGRIAGAAGEGAIIGGLSGAGRGIGEMRSTPTAPEGPQPLQAVDEPIDERVFSVRRPTGQVEMEGVRVHAVSADGKTAVVRGVDAQGAPVEREVPTDSLREDANKNNLRTPAVQPAEASLPQPEGAAEVPEPAMPGSEAPTEPGQPRTITLPKQDGSPNFLIDVDASGQPTRLYTPEGRQFPLSILETNPAVAKEAADAIANYAPQADANVGQSPPADPSTVDVTGTPPEIIPPAAEANDPLPADAAPLDSGSPEQSPVEAPVPVAGAPDAEAGPVPAAEQAQSVDAIEELPGTATRQSMTNLDASPAISDVLKTAVKESALDKYDPRSQADAVALVDKELQSLTTDEAVAKAIRGDVKNSDVRTALRIKTMERVSAEIDAAEASGDTELAGKLAKDALAVADSYAKTLTDAGQGISAARLMNRHSPAAVVYEAEKTVAAKAERQAVKLVPKERKKIAAETKSALENTLASSAVKAVREKTIGASPATTKARIAEAKSERADLLAQLTKLNVSSAISPQDRARAELHVAIFKTYIKEGVLRLRDLVERFKKDGGPAVSKAGDSLLTKQATAALADHRAATDQELSALNRTIDQIARDHSTDVLATGKALAEKFVEGAGLSPADAKTLAAAIEKEFDRRISEARQKRINELNKRAAATPTKRVSQTDLDKTRELFTISPNDDAAIIEHLKRTTKIPTLTPADAANLRRLANNVKNAKGESATNEAAWELLLAQKNIEGVGGYEGVKAFYYGHMLMGYLTHVVNVTATGINGGVQLGLETGYAGYLALGHAARTKELAALGLTAAPFKGIAKSFAGAFDQAWKIMRTGVDPPGAEGGKYQMPNDLEAMAANKDAPAALRNYAKYVAVLSSRPLKALDVFFQVQLTNMRAFNLAIADAIMEGKSLPTEQIWGNAMEKLYSTSLRLQDAQAQAIAEIPGAGTSKNPLAIANVRARVRVQELMEESRDALIARDSRAGAARDAFNSPLEGILGDLASKVSKLTDLEGPGGVQPLKTVVPFTHIVANVLNEMLNYHPLVGGLRAAKGKSGWNENAFERRYAGKERAERALKSALGTALMLSAGTALLGASKLSGAGPDDPEKRRALQARGWQQYSYNFGTEESPNWWSYRITPLFLNLATIAAYNEGQEYDGADYENDPWARRRMAAMTFATLQAGKGLSPLQSISDMLQAIGNTGDGTAADRFMRWSQRQAGSMSATLLTPGGNMTTQVSKLAQSQMEVAKRDAKSPWEIATQNILWGSAPLAYDDLGYPMRMDIDRIQSSAPKWHDDDEKAIRAFQAKYGAKNGSVFLPDAQRMNTDMTVLRLNPTAPSLTAADVESMATMTDADRKEYLQKRGDLEGPMGEQMFADFKRRRALRIREGYADLLHMDLEKIMEENPRQGEQMLRGLYKQATRRAKLEVLNGDSSRLGIDEQTGSDSQNADDLPAE